MTGRVSGRPSPVRMGAVIVCALIASLLAAPPVRAEHFQDVREVVAPDGVAAAVAYSKLAFPDGNPQAVLGRADVFADSLASGVLQKDAPLLLTASAELSQPTEDELKRLGAETVTILGGTSAVSRAVESDLESQGYTVRRVSGATRIETAVAVARSAPKATTALLARAAGGSEPTAAFADALAAGGWAAQTGWPVLLTETERLSAPTAQFLRDGVTNVRVVGGRAAVGDEVIAQIRALGVDAQRVSGPNRFDTAVAVAAQRGFPSAANATEVVLVDGQGSNAWLDGFAAAAYSGRNRAPIVLANSASGTLPDSTLNFLKAGPNSKLLAGWTAPTGQVDTAAQAMGKTAALRRIFQVRMTGRNVVRATDSATTPIWGHGADEGTALLTLTIDQDNNRVDYTFETDLDESTPDKALSLRRGDVDERGPAVFRMGEPDNDGKASGSVSVEDFDDDTTLAELIATPAAFYAELVTNDDDEGALRGQLPNGGEAHLPGEPTFLSIDSREADNWVRVRFAAPVFVKTPLSPTGDFQVTVNNGVPVQLDDSAPSATNPTPGFRELPQSADTAKDSFVLVLKSDAVLGQVTRVTLTSQGAAKLLNNVKQSPKAASQQQVTPADTVNPQFLSVEAASGSNLIHLNFSEPVWTSASLDTTHATLASRHVLVESRDGTGTLASHKGLADIAAITKANRTSRIELRLETPIPSGGEVRVTIQPGTGTAGPQRVKDSKGLTLTGELSRAATMVARGGSLQAQAGDLMIGSTSGQSQSLVVTVLGDMAPGSELRLDLPANGFTYPLIDPIHSGFPSGTTVTRAGAAATNPYVFKLPANAGLSDGRDLRITLWDVTATGTAETNGGAAGRFRVSRGDTGGSAEATFDLLKGAQITGVTYSPAPPSTPTEQIIAITLRPAATSSTVLTLDLTDMVAGGVNYPPRTTTLSFSGITPSTNTVQGELTGSPTRGVRIVPSTGTTGLTVTIPNVTFPGNSTTNAPWTAGRTITAVRSEATETADYLYRATPHFVTALNAWASAASQTVAVRLLNPMAKGQSVGVDFKGNPFVIYPSTGTLVSGPAGDVTAALANQGTPATALWQLRYAPETDVPAGTTIVFSFENVDTRRAPRNFSEVKLLRSDSSLPFSLTPLTNYQIAGGRDIVPKRVQIKDKIFGQSGDKLVIEFTEPVVDPAVTANTTGAQYSVTIRVDAQDWTLTCEVHVTCSRVSGTSPAGTTVLMQPTALGPTGSDGMQKPIDMSAKPGELRSVTDSWAPSGKSIGVHTANGGHPITENTSL